MANPLNTEPDSRWATGLCRLSIPLLLVPSAVQASQGNNFEVFLAVGIVLMWGILVILNWSSEQPPLNASMQVSLQRAMPWVPALCLMAAYLAADMYHWTSLTIAFVVGYVATSIINAMIQLIFILRTARQEPAVPPSRN